MALTVACLTHPSSGRYRKIAEAVCAGVVTHGDLAKIVPHDATPDADVGVMYGWKLNASLRRYPKFIYADLGYWQRETHYRMTVGGWSPEGYVCAGLPDYRLRSLGVRIKPWKSGENVLLIGASEKASREHGFGYMEWEQDMAARLTSLGHSVVYRPKPNDLKRRPIAGCGLDVGSLAHAFSVAKAVVSHHSNVCVEALAAGLPVHCVTGAAAAMSVPVESLGTRRDGREQFLADVAWLQWTLDEIRRGEFWAHIKQRGLV